MTKTQIIDHIMFTPHNTNRAVLKGILGDGNWEALYKYVATTSHNMNRKVLEALIGDSSSGGAGAVVGTAIVGTDVVG